MLKCHLRPKFTKGPYDLKPPDKPKIISKLQVPPLFLLWSPHAASEIPSLLLVDVNG